MPSLKSQIKALADTFAKGVLAVIRGASLGEILEGGGGEVPIPPKRGTGRPKKAAVVAGGGGPDPLAKKAKRGKGGRLMRRSTSDIEHVIGLIAAKLGEVKKGLRSEELQKVLKLDKKEIIRPIELALKAKRITKKGRKRSTTYFAATGAPQPNPYDEVLTPSHPNPRGGSRIKPTPKPAKKTKTAKKKAK